MQGQTKWEAFDYYTMQDAINDGYILDAREHILPYQVPLEFGLPEGLDPDDPDFEGKVSRREADIYAYEPRMAHLAKFVADRLETTVYPRMSGTGKAMLAVSSIPNAVKYTYLIRQALGRWHPKGDERFASAPVGCIYTDRQGQELCSNLNGGMNEENAIKKFKREKNGLIIVVDKLQTGFDEPRLHTLFRTRR